jgi:F-type H+-transporting ATPase subunit b
MQIDWLTVAAQIVNFLVLVWLLKTFLYGPITGAMAQREQRIEQRLYDARQKRQEAEHEAANLKQKQADLDARTDDILDQARHKADALRLDRMAELEEDIATRRAILGGRIEAEQADFLQDLRKRAAASTFEAMRAMLHDLSGSDLVEDMVVCFIKQLKELPKAELKKLAAAAQEAGGKAQIETGRSLPLPIRRKLTRALHEAVAADLDVDYRTEQNLILGVRLGISGQTVEWSLAHHLDRLEQDMREELSRAALSGRDQKAA